MTHPMTKTFCLFFILGFWSGCSVLSTNEDDPGLKSSKFSYQNPPAPFEKAKISTADIVWQSKSTGSTIAVNSLCKKYSDSSLKALRDNILSGVDKLNVEKDETLTYSGRDAQRVLASGTTDGVPVVIDLLIFKKNNCSYDLVFIAGNKHFSREKPVFEDFLKGFTAQ